MHAQSGGAALLEGLSANRSLVEMDVRESQCGDSNALGIRLKLNANRHTRKKCGAADDDDERDKEEDEEEDEEEEDGEEDDEEEVVNDDALT